MKLPSLSPISSNISYPGEIIFNQSITLSCSEIATWPSRGYYPWAMKVLPPSPISPYSCKFAGSRQSCTCLFKCIHRRVKCITYNVRSGLIDRRDGVARRGAPIATGASMHISFGNFNYVFRHRKHQILAPFFSLALPRPGTHGIFGSQVADPRRKLVRGWNSGRKGIIGCIVRLYAVA